jgi:chromosome segregation ATPase
MATLPDSDLEEPIPDVLTDEVERQVNDYRDQIDSLYSHINVLLKMLKNQKDEQSRTRKDSVSMLKSRLESMQGEMDELERENIRTMTSAASSSTDSVVEAVNKAMLAARLNYKVKSLDNRIRVFSYDIARVDNLRSWKKGLYT